MRPGWPRRRPAWRAAVRGRCHAWRLRANTDRELSSDGVGRHVHSVRGGATPGPSSPSERRPARPLLLSPRPPGRRHGGGRVRGLAPAAARGRPGRAARARPGLTGDHARPGADRGNAGFAGAGTGSPSPRPGAGRAAFGWPSGYGTSRPAARRNGRGSAGSGRAAAGRTAGRAGSAHRSRAGRRPPRVDRRRRGPRGRTARRTRLHDVAPLTKASNPRSLTHSFTTSPVVTMPLETPPRPWRATDADRHPPATTAAHPVSHLHAGAGVAPRAQGRVRGALLTAGAALLLAAGAPSAHAQDLTAPLDTAVTTEHTVTIKGQRIPYRATAGHQPVWDENGKPIASLFYVYYERSDV